MYINKIFTAAIRMAVLLLALALAAGCSSHSEEKMQDQAEVNTALCDAHQLPVSDCFMCDPALREPGRLWCNEHARYEDRCFICHPELQEANRLWCREHSLYEDECFFCHPELKKEAKLQDQSASVMEEDAAKITGNELFCKEHNVYERECGICHPDLAGSLNVGEGLKIRFESPASAVKAGLQITRPVEGSAIAGLLFLGQVTYNKNRYARITPLASGVIRRVLTDVGQTVRAGQVMVEIVSPEIAAAKSSYLSALTSLELKESAFQRKKELIDEKIAAQQDFEQAKSDYEMAKVSAETARQQLVNYGFSDNQISEIVATRSATATMPVIAPFSGTIINRQAVIGEVARPGDMLFELAELSTMWLELSIPEDQIGFVTVGDPVEASFDALPALNLTGKITWLAAGLDDHTRMLRARAVIPNPDGLLKHGVYCQARILSQRSVSSLMVPVESLHHFDKKPFVFAKVADDLFEVRRVQVAGKTGNAVEIIAGLSPDDQVVAVHSFTVKSEFLKARLGAGCVDD